MQLKLLSSGELKIVQDLAYAIWPETFQEILTPMQIAFMLEWMYNLETLQKQANEGHQFYLLSNKEKAIGFIGIQPFHPRKNELKIHKIYVLPSEQGTGAGKKLLFSAKEIALKNGIEILVLNVNRFNKAVTFYQHLGFQVDREENISIGIGFWMEDYVMSLSI